MLLGARLVLEHVVAEAHRGAAGEVMVAEEVGDEMRPTVRTGAGRSFSQPMSFTYALRATNGNVQNALMQPPTGRAAASHIARARPGQTARAANAPRTTKMPTIT